MPAQPGNDDPKAQVQDYFSRTAESYVASFSHEAGEEDVKVSKVSRRKDFQAHFPTLRTFGQFMVPFCSLHQTLSAS
jgi:hypothetical protein